MPSSPHIVGAFNTDGGRTSVQCLTPKPRMKGGRKLGCKKFMTRVTHLEVKEVKHLPGGRIFGAAQPVCFTGRLTFNERLMYRDLQAES